MLELEFSRALAQASNGLGRRLHSETMPNPSAAVVAERTASGLVVIAAGVAERLGPYGYEHLVPHLLNAVFRTRWFTSHTIPSRVIGVGKTRRPRDDKDADASQPPDVPSDVPWWFRVMGFAVAPLALPFWFVGLLRTIFSCTAGPRVAADSGKLVYLPTGISFCARRIPLRGKVGSLASCVLLADVGSAS